MSKNDNGGMPANSNAPLPQEILNAYTQALALGEGCDIMANYQCGLTKREHFASICQPPVEVLINSLKEGFSGGFNVEQYIECVVVYKVKEADALLKALEK